MYRAGGEKIGRYVADPAATVKVAATGRWCLLAADTTAERDPASGLSLSGSDGGAC